VLDEADQMLRMGFREAVEDLLSTIPSNLQHQTALFSATVPQWVHELKNRFMHSPTYVDLVGDDETRTAEDVVHLGLICPWNARYPLLPDVLRVHAPRADARSIVFVNRKADADALVAEEGMKNVPCAVLHGDVAQAQRERT